MGGVHGVQADADYGAFLATRVDRGEMTVGRRDTDAKRVGGGG